MAATLEGKFEERIRELASRRVVADQISEEEMDYLLTVAPLIREYQETSDTVMSRAPVASSSDAMKSYAAVTHYENRYTVLQKYLLYVEKKGDGDFENLLDRTGAFADYQCSSCAQTLLKDSRESTMVCPGCGRVTPFTDNTVANLSYTEEVNLHPVNKFSYKRLNHFNEVLNSIQARATSHVPDEVVEAIKAEFKKIRVTTRGEITPGRVKAFMKKLNLNKYYEHAHGVAYALNGTPPARLDEDTETTLRRMFMAIQDPFERAIQNTTRKNFLSYSYVLKKFSELMGRTDLTSHFSMLKSSEKLHQQDVIFKKICADLDWPFVPSI